MHFKSSISILNSIWGPWTKSFISLVRTISRTIYRDPLATIKTERQTWLAEQYIFFVAANVPRSINIEEFINKTVNDPVLSRVIKAIEENKRPNMGEFKSSSKVWDGLAVFQSNLTMRGNRILVPQSLRKIVVSCQLTSSQSSPAPIMSKEFPENPCKYLAIDIHGPLSNGSYLIMLIDEQSKFSVVEEVKSMASQNVLPWLDETFN